MKNFALIGAAGYIAPRHMKAIKDTGNNLVAALDYHDNVGILDSYFPDAAFFTEFERFDRHIDKVRRRTQSVDYISICSPNYLHDAHIRFALRQRANAICEKPLVLNPWNIDALSEIEKETQKKIYTILQLRLHSNIIDLRNKVINGPKDKIYDVDLTYITSRGQWYHHSWKGEVTKSGGIATNIGVHFFDMLTWIFGDVKENLVYADHSDMNAGFLQLERARVRWFLSINYDHLPADVKAKSQRTYRSIKIEEKEIEFSGGFTDLHTLSYQEILKGNGFGLEDARKSIEIVQAIRNQEVTNSNKEKHPFIT